MPAREWNPHDLADEIVQKIDEYLDGSEGGKAVSEWAKQQLAKYDFRSHELLLDEGLTSLMCLGGDEPEWNTSKSELELLRSALRGEADYPIFLRWVPKAVVESVRQTRRSQIR